MKYLLFNNEERELLNLSPDEDECERISRILYEAEHLYYWHGDGRWRSEYKLAMAMALKPFIDKHPSIVRRILDLNNRVYSMVVYAAVAVGKV